MFCQWKYSECCEKGIYRITANETGLFGYLCQAHADELTTYFESPNTPVENSSSNSNSKNRNKKERESGENR